MSGPQVTITLARPFTLLDLENFCVDARNNGFNGLDEVETDPDYQPVILTLRTEER